MLKPAWPKLSVSHAVYACSRAKRKMTDFLQTCTVSHVHRLYL